MLQIGFVSELDAASLLNACSNLLKHEAFLSSFGFQAASTQRIPRIGGNS